MKYSNIPLAAVLALYEQKHRERQAANAKK